MSATDRALNVVAKFNAAGIKVREVVIEGKQIRVVLSDKDKGDEYDLADLSR